MAIAVKYLGSLGLPDTLKIQEVQNFNGLLGGPRDEASYFDVDVNVDSNGNIIPSGPLFGEFDAWCLDFDTNVLFGRMENTRVVSSYDADLPTSIPGVANPERLPLLNWLFNNLVYDSATRKYSVTFDGGSTTINDITYGDLQAVIWDFIDDANGGYNINARDVNVDGPINRVRVANIIQELGEETAAQDYMPGFGETVGIILQPFNENLQDVYIEVEVSRLGDFVWFDKDGDGIQDENEPGIEGVTVNLLADGEVVATAVTDAQGEYLFELTPGNYTVMVDTTTLPDGVVQTGDPDDVLDDMSMVDLPAGGENLDQDFGYQPVIATISLVKQVIGPNGPTDETVEFNLGEEVTFVYTLTNTGNVDLTQVQLVDNNATPSDPSDDVSYPDSDIVLVSGDDIDPGVLNEGEEWVFNYTRTAEFIDGSPLNCDPCQFNVYSAFSGEDISVLITLQEVLDDPNTNDINESGVRITVAVDDTTKIGDLRGLFFDVADDQLAGLSIVGDDITDSLIQANSVKDLGNGAQINGNGMQQGFDVGVEIGTQGISQDDIQSTTFDVRGLNLDDILGQRFGVRLMSVGTIGGNREESSKILGYAPEDCNCNQLQTNFAEANALTPSGAMVVDSDNQSIIVNSISL